MSKRLYRSRQHNVIAGVCGGMGEYFDIDPVFIRVLTVLLIFAHGIGLIGYIVAWIAMPRRPLTGVDSVPETTAEVASDTAPKREPSELGKYLPGLILILIGAIFLADKLFWWFHWRIIWPVLLIIGGALLLWKSSSHPKNNGGVHESFES